MNEIIEKLVAKFGVEKTVKGLTTIGLIKEEAQRGGGKDCDPGYYWNETLSKCVLDIG